MNADLRISADKSKAEMAKQLNERRIVSSCLIPDLPPAFSIFLVVYLR